MCAKHKIFIQSGNDSKKTQFLVVFGNNNSSVSNPNDFNTRTSSKSTCWDEDMLKTYKFYSELKILLKNHVQKSNVKSGHATEHGILLDYGSTDNHHSYVSRNNSYIIDFQLINIINTQLSR